MISKFSRLREAWVFQSIDFQCSTWEGTWSEGKALQLNKTRLMMGATFLDFLPTLMDSERSQSLV
jgi:hypothetical protein